MRSSFLYFILFWGWSVSSPWTQSVSGVCGPEGQCFRLTLQLQCIKRNYLLINTTCRGKQLSFPHSETLKLQQRLLYNSRESLNDDKYGIRTMLRDPQDMGAKTRCCKCLPQSRRRYTETGLEAYSFTRKRIAPKSFRCSFFFLDYHVDNGCLLEKTRNECGIEKIRILDSHGSVIVITRDRGHILVQNKYSIEPTTLVMDVSSCNVMNNSNGYQ